jgi:DivIVA domain-containing protein
VALDRQSIEKKDFPIGRRGYDPAAVDAHLAGLADELEELKRSTRRRTESLAVSASEQVRAIVEAAETSAHEIQHQAEDEAREIRDEASTEARMTRENATSQARDYVGKVSESTATMLQRLEAMESEMSALFESLRTGSNRLGADLQLLEGNLDEVRDAVAPRPRFEPESAAPPVGASVPEPEPAPAITASVPEPEPAPAISGPLPEHDLFAEQAEPESSGATEAPGESPSGPGDAAEEEAEKEQAPGADATREDANGRGDDTESARLIALNMALSGSTREETDRYLADHFRLTDRRGLLDEVFESLEG